MIPAWPVHLATGAGILYALLAVGGHDGLCMVLVLVLGWLFLNGEQPESWR